MNGLKGYDGRYEIYPDGRIFSLRHKYGLRHTPKLLVTRKNRCGYHLISLTDDTGTRKTFSLHRLVAIQFCDNVNGFPVVDHIDGNKDNNAASNLEWVSKPENERRAHRIGLKSNKGSRHSQARLDDISVAIIREAWLKFGRGSQPKIAKYFGVNHATVSAIVTKNRWSS